MLRVGVSIYDKVGCPWHNYKHTVELVGKYYANMLFVPLFHHMYPGNKLIFKNVCPQEPTMFMLYVA